MDSENTNKQTSLGDIFSSSNCLSWEALESYHNKSLPKEQQYKAEKHLLECELCSDALEGMDDMNDLTVNKSIINKINRKIQEQSGNEKSTAFKLEINYQTIAIAASFLLIIGVSTVYFSMFYSPEKNKISDASSTQKDSKENTNNQYHRKAGRAPLEAETDQTVLAELKAPKTTSPIVTNPLVKETTTYGTTATPKQTIKEEALTNTPERLKSDISVADEASPQTEQETTESLEVAEPRIAEVVSRSQEDITVGNSNASKSASAPSSPELKKQKTVNSLSKDASFPGGTNELQKYIQSNINIPESNDISQNLASKVIVKFTIKKSGKISNIIISQGSTDSNNQEAIRLVSNMPKWEAATQDGEPIESEYTLPIEFKH